MALEIRLSGVSVDYYPGTAWQTRALAGVNLLVGENEEIALLGPGGAGKSTLLRVMAGLLAPGKGQVLVPEGGRVALALQEPQRGFFAATAWEEVAFGPENFGLGAGEVEERVRWALSAVGLPEEKWSRSPFALSGGEQRRLALAAVLSMRPRFLLLDEPAAGLDAWGKRDLGRILRELVKKTGMTLVMTGHEVDFVFPLTRRVLVLARGRLAADTTWGRLGRDPVLLEQLGLELPTALRLLRRLAEKGAPVDPGQESLEGAIEEFRKLLG
ncbi:MAG: ATP-binding cassette domain-containing protein [Firmicutes bacterium]|nr:ATP-binding cassette domain-containing protein [Bacillota bacterium]